MTNDDPLDSLDPADEEGYGVDGTPLGDEESQDELSADLFDFGADEAGYFKDLSRTALEGAAKSEIEMDDDGVVLDSPSAPEDAQSAPLGTPRVQFGIQSRTLDTENKYVKRAEWLFERAAREFSCPISEVGSMRFVAWLSLMRPKLSKSTWRQYKSAVIYYLRSRLGDPESMQAADELEPQNSLLCKATSEKTSSRRRKSISQEEFAKFLAFMNGVKSHHRRYIGITKTWLLFGAHSGLRPHEWAQTEMIGPVEEGHPGIEQDGLAVGGYYLKTRNSKHTNGRANGAYRHLDISEFSPSVLETLRYFVVFMRQQHEQGTFEAMFSRCRRLLQDVNKQYYEGQKRAKHIHLYSARHRFASEAKKRLATIEVAAAMGHANDQTAYSMYGNAREGGGSGAVIAKPVSKETTTVRQVRRGRLAIEKAIGVKKMAGGSENK